MAKDRSIDRHVTPGRLVRPKPPELWEEAEDAVGNRERSGLISALLAWYLRHEPIEAKWLDRRPKPPAPPSG